MSGNQQRYECVGSVRGAATGQYSGGGRGHGGGGQHGGGGPRVQRGRCGLRQAERAGKRQPCDAHRRQRHFRV